jgi:peptidoglycan/LPS O-acetylase OafA/YrhL
LFGDALSGICVTLLGGAVAYVTSIPTFPTSRCTQCRDALAILAAAVGAARRTTRRCFRLTRTSASIAHLVVGCAVVTSISACPTSTICQCRDALIVLATASGAIACVAARSDTATLASTNITGAACSGAVAALCAT